MSQITSAFSRSDLMKVVYICIVSKDLRSRLKSMHNVFFFSCPRLAFNIMHMFLSRANNITPKYLYDLTPLICLVQLRGCTYLLIFHDMRRDSGFTGLNCYKNISENM